MRWEDLSASDNFLYLAIFFLEHRVTFVNLSWFEENQLLSNEVLRILVSIGI